jgi:hypothetical protein
MSPQMHPTRLSRIGALYDRHFSDSRRERLFVSSATFFGSFAAVRGITHAIRRGVGPFRNLAVGGRHLHHLVFGIAGLLGGGYLWLVQIGLGREGEHDGLSRATAALYGASAAITLDEFALWLDLQDVYWAKQGRESIDAVLLFGGALSIGLWGAPFFRDLVREAGRLFPRQAGEPLVKMVQPQP